MGKTTERKSEVWEYDEVSFFCDRCSADLPKSEREPGAFEPKIRFAGFVLAKAEIAQHGGIQQERVMEDALLILCESCAEDFIRWRSQSPSVAGAA